MTSRLEVDAMRAADWLEDHAPGRHHASGVRDILAAVRAELLS